MGSKLIAFYALNLLLFCAVVWGLNYLASNLCSTIFEEGEIPLK